MPCASTGMSLSFSAVGFSCVAEQASAATGHKHRHRSARPSCPLWQARSRGWPKPSICRRRPCRCRSRSGCGAAAPRSSRSALPRRPARSSAAARSSSSNASPLRIAKAGRVGDDRRDPADELARADPRRRAGGRSAGRPDGPWPAHRKRDAACHCFSLRRRSIFAADEQHSGVGRPRARPVRRHQRSVGPSGSGGDEPRRRRRTRAAARGASRPSAGAPSITPGAGVSSLDELLRRGRARFGGGGGGLPGRPDRSLIVWAVVAVRPGVAGLHLACTRSRPASAAWSPASAATATRLDRASG